MPQLNGFVVLHRSILNWGWHSDPATGWLFINLILLASHAPTEWKGIRLDRGQLITGRKSLADQTGLSERQIRTALEHLKSTGEVTIKPTNKYSLITLVNYRKFQDIPDASTSTSTSISTNSRPATDHIVTNKQYKQEVVYAREAAAADESDLLSRIADHQRADDLIRRYQLPDGDTSREALLEDAERIGWPKLEGALQAASRSNSRQRLSVNFYRRFLNNVPTTSGGEWLAIENL